MPCDGVFTVVMQQSFQRAVSTYRKRKGQDSERLEGSKKLLAFSGHRSEASLPCRVQKFSAKISSDIIKRSGLWDFIRK